MDAVISPTTAISSTDLHSRRLPYESPRLSVFGDVCSLTETGSNRGWESPLNLCLLDINQVNNSCKP